MGTEDITPLAAAAATDEDQFASATPMDLLKQKRSNIGKEQEFDIPGYDGMLVGRYRVLGFDESRMIGKKHQKGRDNPRWLLNLQIDTLIESLVELKYRNDEGDLVDIQQGETIRYDMKLAEGMGFADEVETARGVVLRLFDNEPAILSHSQDVMNWMTSGRSETADLGEV